MRGRNRLSSRVTTATIHAEVVMTALCLRRPGSVVEVRDTPHGHSSEPKSLSQSTVVFVQRAWAWCFDGEQRALNRRAFKGEEDI